MCRLPAIAVNTLRRIRLLTPDDAREWRRLRQDALQGDPEAFSASEEEHHALHLTEVRKRLSADGEDSFVVGTFKGERLIGMAGFYRKKGGSGTV